MSFFTRKNKSYPDILSEYNGQVPYYFIYCGEIHLKQHFDDIWVYGRKDWYLLYLLSGTMEVTIGDETVEMTGGDLYIISPDTYFAYNNTKTIGEHIKYRFIHFLGFEAQKAIEDCELPINKVFKVGIHEELIELWEQLFEVSVGNDERLDELFGKILPYIFWRISYLSASIKPRTKKLDTSIKYIHMNVSNDIKVEELARMEFLSPSRYREVFKKITGTSPSNYISSLRVRLACELFLEGNSSIDDVAKAVGFSDRLYFQRFFKKHTGTTPGKYLEGINKKENKDKSVAFSEVE